MYRLVEVITTLHYLLKFTTHIITSATLYYILAVCPCNTATMLGFYELKDIFYHRL